MNLDKALHYLYNLKRLGIRPGLERIRSLLESLGNPHLSFPSILIGGTNGKGSTCAILAEILTRAGYRTGLYTSPHMERFTERIRVDGKEVESEKMAELVERLRIVVENRGIGEVTFFELVTAMAFLHFAEEGIDIGVVEVGMGGRLDATNILDPIITIVTTVSKDHEEFLGRKIEEIAEEKGGIIRKGIPLITGAKGRALKVLKRIVEEKGAHLKVAGKDFHIRERGEGLFDYHGTGIYRSLELSLKGRHQILNASLAVSAVESLAEKGFRIDERAVREGLKGVRWPGRLELLDMGGKRILLDAAHNPSGARALRAYLTTFPCRDLYLVVGMMRDKRIRDFLRPFAQLARSVILTQPKGERAASVETLLAISRAYNQNSTGIRDVEEALEYGLELTGKEDLLCVTGSIFLLGEAKAWLRERAVPWVKG